MEVSYFLAAFWGWFFVIFFAILIINSKRFKQMFEYIKDEKLLYIGGFIAIIIGLLNILFHNIWELDWRLIITFIGWISLSKGILFLALPKLSRKLVSTISIRKTYLMLIFILFLGIYLLNKSYDFLIY